MQGNVQVRGILKARHYQNSTIDVLRSLKDKQKKKKA